jgi:hypothetical protein
MDLRKTIEKAELIKLSMGLSMLTKIGATNQEEELKMLKYNGLLDKLMKKRDELKCLYS